MWCVVLCYVVLKVLLLEGLPPLARMSSSSSSTAGASSSLSAQRQQRKEVRLLLSEKYLLPAISTAHLRRGRGLGVGIGVGRDRGVGVGVGFDMDVEMDVEVGEDVSSGDSRGAHLYLFPGSVKHLHPEFDAVLLVLLRTDPQALVPDT